MVERVTEANAMGVHLYVPIHTNAHNGNVIGTRIFVCSTSGNAYKAATAIYNVLAPITLGQSENISVNTKLYELIKTAAPAVYIEAEFHDNPEAAKWIVENTEAIGEAIAEGICAHYNVVYQRKLYHVQVGAYANIDNAKRMLATLKSAGFDAFIAQ